MPIPNANYYNPFYPEEPEKKTSGILSRKRSSSLPSKQNFPISTGSPQLNSSNLSSSASPSIKKSWLHSLQSKLGSSSTSNETHHGFRRRSSLTTAHVVSDSLNTTAIIPEEPQPSDLFTSSNQSKPLAYNYNISDAFAGFPETKDLQKRNVNLVGAEQGPLQPVLNITPTPSKPEKTGGFFGSIKKIGHARRSSNVSKQNGIPPLSQNSSNPSLLTQSRRTSIGQISNTSVKLNRNAKNATHDQSFDKLNKIFLKRVTFDLERLIDDPPQQIPARDPKKGNILLDNNGKIIKRHDLLTTELVAKAQEYAYANAIATQKIAYNILLEENKSLEKKDAMKSLPVEEVPTTGKYLKLNDIDQPIHLHHHFGAEEEEVKSHSDDDQNNPSREAALKEISLETIYTRCCHLREILPIPITLRQLKNKTKPLSVLKMLNPRPTMIDILSFSDFLSIVPILSIGFDNVTLSSGMLQVIFSSIVNAKQLEKLSMRNVAMDAEGWRLLCAFLAHNKSVTKLDISQRKIRDESKGVRRDMDWKLFTNAIIKRGGLEELVIHGCCLKEEDLDDLISRGCALGTRRLGYAENNLSLHSVRVLGEWIFGKDSTCIGIDIGFNNLSDKLGPLTEILRKREAESPQDLNLTFLSLNSTQLTSDNDDFVQFLVELSRVHGLRFFDISSNPHLFPGTIPQLSISLPIFKDLRRVHLDSNHLTSTDIVKLAEIFPKCKTLFHVSLVNNKGMDFTAAVALYAAVKNSRVYELDIDYNHIPEKVSQRIAIICLRNLESLVNTNWGNLSKVEAEKRLSNILQKSPGYGNETDAEFHDELMVDGSLLAEAVGTLVENENQDDTVIAAALVDGARKVRRKIHRVIDALFELRDKGLLSIAEKEKLILFCFLDNALEKLVHLSEEIQQNKESKYLENVHKGKRNSQEILENKKHDSDGIHKESRLLASTGNLVPPNNLNYVSNESTSEVTLPIQPETSFEPHVVKSDPENGNVVDAHTGRPVLVRRASSGSVLLSFSKKLEIEEGELHRWGTFVSGARNKNEENAEKHGEEHQAVGVSQSPDGENNNSLGNGVKFPVMKVLPSGEEIRKAVLGIKGVDNISTVIERIKTVRNPSAAKTDHNKDELSDNPGDSGNSFQEKKLDTNDKAVNEAYDKLLEQIDKARTTA